MGLKWAEVTVEGPWSSSGTPRGSGARARGYRYERKVNRYLQSKFPGTVLYQHWIQFEDSNGPGWACPDFVCVPTGREKHRLILDAKLSATWRAEDQLCGLYLPLLRVIEPDVKWSVIQVAKNAMGLRTPILSIEDVLALPPGETVHFWHWLG